MIPNNFENVERTAIVIKPKQPFWDWLISHDPDQDLPHFIIIDPEIYLLPDFEEIDEMKKWLKKHFDTIFCDQMNHWYTDTNLWVNNRTHKMFLEWFDISFHTMLWDTLDSHIDKT
jgi:hypothetical protein